MAGIDVGGGGGGRRATNSEINMIPFIDLLMVTIAFLLITAVWVTNSRISTNAEAPGAPCTADCGETPVRQLHVMVGRDQFGLVWKQAGTVVSETKVARPESRSGDGRYPELARALIAEYARQGVHTDPLDRKSDQAILHTEDKAPFRDIVAVLDAVNSAQRDVRFADGTTKRVPAFQTTFSAR